MRSVGPGEIRLRRHRRVDGLGQCRYGELVGFSSGVMGMAQNLEPDTVWVVLLGTRPASPRGRGLCHGDISPGCLWGEGLIGRWWTPWATLGRQGPSGLQPYPPAGERRASDYGPRRGQRAADDRPDGHRRHGAHRRGPAELIIGDRQTGKTAIASDTVLNQKGKDVVCVYVAVGQKASTVAQMVNTFTQMGAMAYTIVVSATAGDPVLMQYEAPYAGCAIERGAHVPGQGCPGNL